MYNKDFFENKFNYAANEEESVWRFWRASQKNRMKIMNQNIQKICTKLASAKKIIVCEIGVATADFTQLYYMKKRMKVLGIDISERAVKICKKKYDGDKNITFRQGDLFCINEKQKFDIIICMDTLHYYNSETIEEAIKKFCFIKDKFGFMVLSVPLKEDDEWGNDFVSIVKRHAEIIEMGYINNYFYDHTIEPKLLYVYDVLCVDKLLGKFGVFMGKTIIKAIMKSMIIFKICSAYGNLLGKRSNSHIYILAK